MDRRVRATDRLTRAASEHKVRIKDLVRQLLPATPLTGDLGQADLAVLGRWADPRALLAAGPARLTAAIVKASHGHQGAERAAGWRAAASASASAAIELYAAYPAMPFADLAAEVATEVRLLRAVTAELAEHAASKACQPHVPVSSGATSPLGAPGRSSPRRPARGASPCAEQPGQPVLDRAAPRAAATCPNVGGDGPPLGTQDVRQGGVAGLPRPASSRLRRGGK